MDRHGASLSHLLLLYVWPTAIFENAATGTKEERWAKYRRNREKRVYLPHYGKVWSIFSLVFLLSGQWFSSFATVYIPARIAAAIFYIGFTYALVVLIIVIVAYVWLTHIQ